MTHRTVPLDLLVRVRDWIQRGSTAGLTSIGLEMRGNLVAELTAQIEQREGQSEPAAWRCFHCDEVFTTMESARLHFGVSLLDEPACQIDVAHLRGMESQLARYREEDTDLHREIYRLISKHRRELVTEEEKGYARGLRDATPQDSVPAWAMELVAKWRAMPAIDYTDHERGFLAGMTVAADELESRALALAQTS